MRMAAGEPHAVGAARAVGHLQFLQHEDEVVVR
jgi:hypothetical protein